LEPESVIIIGGGLAGLTAASRLAERGLAPLVLEANPETPGGRVGGGASYTLRHGEREYIFAGEHGIHGIWGQYANLRDLLAGYAIDPGYRAAAREAWILRSRGGRVQWAEGGSALRRSWIPAPFHYLALFVRPRFLQMLTLRDLASMFRVLGELVFTLAYDPAVETAPLHGRTLADYFKGWSPTMQALFTGLARNFASEAPERVPQSGFIAFLRFYTLLRRDAWAFSYFNKDAGRALVQPLVTKLEANGGALRLGCKVERIVRDGDSWRVETETESFSAGHIVLALDAPGARTLLANSPDLPGEGLAWPQATPTAVLRFWFSVTPRLMAEAGIFTGDFTLDNFFWLHRFQTDFEEWHAATGGCAVEAHIYGPPDLLREPDAALLARGLTDLVRVWPGLRGRNIGQTIRRNPPTHTLFDSDGLQLGVETDWPSVAVCGDWVRFPHPSLYLERAVVTGTAAANVVLAAQGLEVFPILQPKPPEPLARWIQGGLLRIRRAARARKRRSAN